MSTIARWFFSSIAEVKFSNNKKVIAFVSALLAWPFLALNSAHAQCGDWSNYSQWVGTIAFSGAGAGTSGNLGYSFSSAFGGFVNIPGPPQYFDPGCAWGSLTTTPGNIGVYTVNAFNNIIPSPCSNGDPYTWNWSGSGILCPEGVDGCVYGPNMGLWSTGLDIGLPGNILIANAGPLLTETTNYCGQVSTTQVGEGLGTGATIAVPSVPVPVLSGSVSGTYTNFAGPGSYTLTYNLSAVPNDTTDQGCDATGSDIGCQNQSLGEDVPIVGTSFFLRYQSDRVLARAGADTVATLDALSLGGWTISVHHVLELQSLSCLQNSGTVNNCSATVLVPKAVYLGAGQTISAANIGSPVVINGNYYIASQDGSEVYVFNSSGIHQQTLKPLTGALEYQFGYDAAGNLVTITDANANVTTIQRNANETPTAIVSPYNQTTQLTTASDGSNNYLSQITDPAGNSYNLTFMPGGLLSTLTDPRGNQYTFQYDSYGRLTKDSDPAGGFTTLTRTNQASGYVVAKETALGRTTSYQITFPASNASEQEFVNTFPDGLQATVTTQPTSYSSTLPDGESTNETLGPDPRWGIEVAIPTSTTQTFGSLTSNASVQRTVSLGTAGNPFSLVTQTDTKTVNGRTYSSVFTASNLTYTDTSPAGRITLIILDNQERVASGQTGDLLAKNFAYDTLGRLATVTQGNRTTTLSYNSNGFLASVTDPLGLQNSFTYDADGHVLTRTLADGRVITYTYDANGNQTSVTPPGKSAHSFTFSPVNLTSSYTPPTVTGTGTTTYAYNLDRQLTTTTRPDGETIVYNYDTAGRLSSVVTPTETLNYGYSTSTGNLSSVAVKGGEHIAYSYNGPLPTKTTWTGTVSGNVDRTYNDNLWVASQNVAGGTDIDLHYDNDGQLTKAGELVIDRSAQDGSVTRTTLGVATDDRTYNSFGELIGYSASANGTVVYSVTLTRDKDGRITTKTETVNGTSNQYAHKYDPAGRLTAVTNNSGSDTYTYDTNSNRLTATSGSVSVSGTYDAQDRLLTYGAASYTYTANGELASKTVGAQTNTYQYDVLGNLIAVTLANGTAITYIVDAANRRVGEEVNGVLQTGFLYDGQGIVAQLNGSNQLVSQFVYATRSNTPDYMINSGVTYRIFCDELGSPVLVINTSTGAIAEQITYDEFGNVLSDTNPGFQPFGFAGGLYDQDTKLVHFGARDYDPSVGRWTAKDPILFAGGDTNLYGYVLNDPINRLDPLGLDNFWTASVSFGFILAVQFNFTEDQNGNYYAGIGPELGTTIGMSFSAMGFTLNGCSEGGAERAEQVRNFITGWSFNGTAGEGVATSQAWTPGQGTATGWGVTSPGFAFAATYTSEAAPLELPNLEGPSIPIGNGLYMEVTPFDLMR